MWKWFNAHSVCFMAGLALVVAGAYGVYKPAAAIVAGSILMGISVLGTRGMVRK